MTHAEHHPTHDRSSCKEENPGYNADASYSGGCARCTALYMDQRDECLLALKRLMDAPISGTAATMKRAREHAQAVIDKLEAK